MSEAWVKAVLDNAGALLEDARTLLDKGSSRRALSLTILAQEELGKVIAHAPDEKSHVAKSLMTAQFALAGTDVLWTDEQARQDDRLKQRGFYVDVRPDGTVLSPLEAIDRDAVLTRIYTIMMIAAVLDPDAADSATEA